MSSSAADEVPLDRHVQLEKDTDLRVPVGSGRPVGCPVLGRTEQKWLSKSREEWDGNSIWNSYPNYNININRTVRSNIPDILEVFDIPINKIEGYLIKMDMLAHMTHITNNIW